jgi:hypothetical protein
MGTIGIFHIQMLKGVKTILNLYIPIGKGGAGRTYTADDWFIFFILVHHTL